MSIFRSMTFYILVVALSFASYSIASAQVDFTSDEAAFIAANPLLELQTFNAANVPPGGTINCGIFVDENTNNACFTPGDILPNLGIGNSGDNALIASGANVFTNNNPANVLVTNIATDSFEILLGGAANRVGITIGCLAGQVSVAPGCDDTIDVTVFGTTGPIGSTTVSVDDEVDTFVGITADGVITQVNVGPTNVTANTFPALLNIRFGSDPRNVPSLSEWGLIAMAGVLGLAGFIVVRRRQLAV